MLIVDVIELRKKEGIVGLAMVIGFDCSDRIEGVVFCCWREGGCF